MVKESNTKQTSTFRLPCSPHESFGSNPYPTWPRVDNLPRPVQIPSPGVAACSPTQKEDLIKSILASNDSAQGLMEYLMPHGGCTQELPQKQWPRTSMTYAELLYPMLSTSMDS